MDYWNNIDMTVVGPWASLGSFFVVIFFVIFAPSFPIFCNFVQIFKLFNQLRKGNYEEILNSNPSTGDGPSSSNNNQDNSQELDESGADIAPGNENDNPNENENEDVAEEEDEETSFIGRFFKCFTNSFLFIASIWRKFSSLLIWFSIDFAWGPVLVLLVLFASKVLPAQVVVSAILGNEKSKPYTVMIMFFSLAYICLSLDATGLFSWIAKIIVGRTKSSGRFLYIVVSIFTSVFASFAANDIVILTLTPIICYMAQHINKEVAEMQKREPNRKLPKFDPIPYLLTVFYLANVWGDIFQIGNTTNLMVSEEFTINFLDYSMWMSIPSIVSSVACFFLTFFIFFKRIPSKMPNSSAKRRPRSIRNGESQENIENSLRLQKVAESVGYQLDGPSTSTPNPKRNSKENRKKSFLVGDTPAGFASPYTNFGNFNAFDRSPMITRNSGSGEKMVYGATYGYGSAGGYVDSAMFGLETHLPRLTPFEEELKMLGAVDVSRPAIKRIQLILKILSISEAVLKSFALLCLLIALLLCSFVISINVPSFAICLGFLGVYLIWDLFRDLVFGTFLFFTILFDIIQYNQHRTTIFHILFKAIKNFWLYPGNLNLLRIATKFPWTVFPFAFSMFIMVELLRYYSWISKISEWFTSIMIYLSGRTTTKREDLTFGQLIKEAFVNIVVFMYSSGISCNFLSNQPMTSLFTSFAQSEPFRKYWDGATESIKKGSLLSIIIASNLGPNISLFGELGGIMWITILRSNGIKNMGFWTFLYYGLLITPAVMLFSALSIFGEVIAVEAYYYYYLPGPDKPTPPHIPPLFE